MSHFTSDTTSFSSHGPVMLPWKQWAGGAYGDDDEDYWQGALT